MLPTSELRDQINYRGRDWAALRAYLTAELDNSIGLLISATSEPESHQLRGRILLLRTLLNLEKNAADSQR